MISGHKQLYNFHLSWRHMRPGGSIIWLTTVTELWTHRSRCVTVLKWSVLDAVCAISLIHDLTVCQCSRRVPDLRLHVVSSPPGQRTGVHRELCGGFSENSWRREEERKFIKALTTLLVDEVFRLTHTAPCPSTPGPNTLTLEVSTAGSTITLAGKPGTVLPPYLSSRVYMPEVSGT